MSQQRDLLSGVSDKRKKITSQPLNDRSVDVTSSTHPVLCCQLSSLLSKQKNKKNRPSSDEYTPPLPPPPYIREETPAPPARSIQPTNLLRPQFYLQEYLWLLTEQQSKSVRHYTAALAGLWPNTSPLVWIAHACCGRLLKLNNRATQE